MMQNTDGIKACLYRIGRGGICGQQEGFEHHGRVGRRFMDRRSELAELIDLLQRLRRNK